MAVPSRTCGAVFEIGYLKDVRRLNREIVESSVICDELRFIGHKAAVSPPGMTKIPQAMSRAAIVGSATYDEANRKEDP